ncbi:Thiol-disulfide isomerase or thioredoxin [Nitrosospira sp. Nsp11]|uniref:TlpA disulfide reductase family protein n=1 Tax=Nitrosospira sp. Nsp11 TaxID=1855338 RepID=UPI00091ADD48|nr:TlpA disulfide reductase family protein [Nitrosospira sp. Nsp11]SHL93295.1 Thiol-disulfide isomerase or thioredoxin [Nitrosospira sp. Nsp11]
MDFINIGLIAFHINFLLLLGAMLIGSFVAKRIGGRQNVDVEPLLWRVFIASLIAARLFFVIAYFDMYQSAPLSILNILDGGFSPAAGILAAVAGVIWYACRVREGRRPLLLAALTGGAAWAVGAVAATAVFAVPVQMPQAELVRLDGSRVQFSSLAGKPTVVNLWATWCPPCIREMPVLRDAQKNNPEVIFVFANQGESADAIQRFLDRERLNLDNVLLDPRIELSSQTQSQGLPTTLFFDAKGALVDRRIGELSAATLAQRIERIVPRGIGR